MQFSSYKSEDKMGEIETAIADAFGHKLRVRISGICLKDNQILLVKHKTINAEGILWAPPGGGMQFGESAIETLKREFLEETGLEIQVGALLFVNEYMESPLHAIELFFEVKMLNDNIKIGIDPELGNNQIISEVRFVHWEEIKNSNLTIYHSCLHKLQHLNDILQLKGYQQNIKQ